jgi:hypothetical protein
MEYLPVNVVCSPKALERYLELDPITPDKEKEGWIGHYEEGAAQLIVRELSKGVPMEAINRVLEEDWYPEWWERSKAENPGMHRRAQESAVISVAKLYGVPYDFPDYESIAECVAMERAKIGSTDE